jgi:hypothetical protein
MGRYIPGPQLSVKITDQPTAIYNEILLHETDDGTFAWVKENGEVVIGLNEDVKDSGKWVVKSIDPMFVKTDESKKGVAEELIERVFRFKPTFGVGVICFTYLNPWVENSPILKKISFTISAVPV